jgi:hypothetical protein
VTVTGSTPRRRVLTATVGAFAPLAVVAVTAVAVRGRLPGTLPVHWSGFGTPDRFAPAWAVLGSVLGATGLAAALGVAGIAVHRRRTTGAGLVSLAAGLGGVACAVWLTAVATTLPGTDPQDARLGWHVLWIPAGVAWAVTVALLLGRTRRPAPPAPAPPPGPRVAWVTVLRSGLLVTIPLVAAGTVAAVALTTDPLIWPVITLPLAALLFFSDLRVIVDHRGLRLVTGPFAVPVKRVPIADIVTATAEHIDPLKWGGWGYRVVPGRSALVLRAGPGLVLDLRDGRRFAVTVDQPDVPAALLTDLRRTVA